MDANLQRIHHLQTQIFFLSSNKITIEAALSTHVQTIGVVFCISVGDTNLVFINSYSFLELVGKPTNLDCEAFQKSIFYSTINKNSLKQQNMLSFHIQNFTIPCFSCLKSFTWRILLTFISASYNTAFCCGCS